MSVYFKIKDGERSPALYVDMKEAKEFLESMAQGKCDHGGEERYSFEAVEMTKEEFESLPDFNGF